MHRLQVSPQRVIHIVYFQDTHLCNKQGGETRKGESIALWSGTEVLVISYLYVFLYFKELPLMNMGYFCNYKSTFCFIWLKSASFSPIASLCPPQPAQVPGPWTPGSFRLARGAGVPPALLPSLQPLSPSGLLASPPRETKAGAGAGRVSIHPAAQCRWGHLGLGVQGRRCRLPRGLVAGGSE